MTYEEEIEQAANQAATNERLLRRAHELLEGYRGSPTWSLYQNSSLRVEIVKALKIEEH